MKFQPSRRDTTGTSALRFVGRILGRYQHRIKSSHRYKVQIKSKDECVYKIRDRLMEDVGRWWVGKVLPD